MAESYMPLATIPRCLLLAQELGIVIADHHIPAPNWYNNQSGMRQGIMLLLLIALPPWRCEGIRALRQPTKCGYRKRAQVANVIFMSPGQQT